MSNIECPYCGENFHLNHGGGAHYAPDGYEEEQCKACDKTIMVSTSVIYLHEANKADCLNTDNPKYSDHDWRNTTATEWTKKGFNRYNANKCCDCGKIEKLEFISNVGGE